MEQSTFSFTSWLIFTALHFVIFSLIVLHALRRRRNASATLLWIFVAWSFPFFGPLLYICFGIDRVSYKGLKKQASNQAMMREREELYSQVDTFVAWHLKYRTKMADIENGPCRDLNLSLNILNPEHPLLDSNDIIPLISGDEAYPLMFKAIRSAQHHIHLQSFIIHSDTIGQQFLDELKAKAEAGVKVKVLFDRFGSAHAYFGGMFRKYRNIPNLEICGWTQANPLKAQFQINLRNHRKTLIVDGHKAFFGGVNIAADNTTEKHRQAIRDYHFKVEGPLVHELQLSFLRDWYFMTRQPIESLLNGDNFPKMLSVGSSRARLIDSGPSETPGMIGEAIFNAIVLAKKQVLIVTPYFVPTNDILKALRSASRRGVDICIINPEKNNHKYAGLASKSLYEELLESGVRIYLRKPPFIHAKAMIVDNLVALVGTANLDVRSLELNYETTVLIEDEAVVGKLKATVLEEISKSTEITLNKWLKRPAIQKLGENLCALMTPVL